MLAAELADLTPTSENDLTEATGRVDTLVGLTEELKDQLDAIVAMSQQKTSASERLDALTQERDQLTAVKVPVEVSRLSSQERTAATAVQQAAGATRAAVDTDDAARTAIAAAPPRHELKTLLEQHRKHEELKAKLPQLGQAADDAAEAERKAHSARSTAEDLRDEARRHRGQSESRYMDASDIHRALIDQRQLLSGVVIPEGLHDLAARFGAIDAAYNAALVARDAAETHDFKARDHAEAAPERGPLEQSLRNLGTLTTTRDDLMQQTEERDELTEAREDVGNTEELAAQAAASAKERLDQLSSQHQAAELRSHLTVGVPCPVCDQPVTTLPTALQVADFDRARDEVDTANAHLLAVQKAKRDAESAQQRQQIKVDALRHRHDELLAQLGEPVPTREALQEVLATISSIHAASRAAAGAYRTAREQASRALAERQELVHEVTVARQQLRQAHRPLTALGAPDIDADGASDGDALAAGWSQLTTWAAEQIVHLDGRQLPDAAAQLQTAADVHDQAKQEERERVESYRNAQQAYDASVQHTQTAAGQRDIAQASRSHLSDVLQSKPTADEVTWQLTILDDLERKAADAAAQLKVRRLEQQDADAEHATWTQALNKARDDLTTARDPLVALGAPSLDVTDLAAAWNQLAAWASEQAASRSKQALQARSVLEASVEERHRLTRGLESVLVQHSITLNDQVDLTRDADLPNVRTALELERERATRHVTDTQQRLSHAVKLAGAVKAAAEEKHVAELLKQLLRSGNFPDWLAATALDSLVGEASHSLRELSGGQFDLTHTNGDFFVIDHHDADSERSVKTLSGGETFQASLALAMALSGQMATLAAGGTARLDSIFLDEGFGTLDPDALDIVAGTLETLSQGQRMVGVVTHVAALAERARSASTSAATDAPPPSSRRACDDQHPHRRSRQRRLPPEGRDAVRSRLMGSQLRVECRCGPARRVER